MSHRPPEPPVLFRTVSLSNPQYEVEDLREVTVKSAALGGRADITVHATPAARRGRDVPLVILLHGVYSSHWAWVRQAGAHRLAARLQQEGAIPPCVLAMPSDGLWGDGSGYLRHHVQDFERWIAFEVPAAVAQAVPSVTAASPRLIAGLSMGGFGALRIGAAYPDRFHAISGLSSITDVSQMRDFVEEWMDDVSPTTAGRSVADAMLRHRDRLPAIRFDCGTEDSLLQANRNLHARLVEAGIAHTYEEFPGGHTWDYWSTHLEKTLRFFAEALAGRRK
jgi:enterochelin esterase-like enzyme